MSAWFDLHGAEPTRDTDVVAAWAVDGHELGVVLNALPADGPVHPAVQTIFPDRIESVCETTHQFLVSLTFDDDEHRTAMEAAAIVAAWGCTFMILRTGGGVVTTEPIATATGPATDRHARMVAAAEMLTRVGFARVGWGDVADGKAPIRRWKSDATDDVALVPRLLSGARNALVIPKGRGIVIDVDQVDVWAELAAVGLPPTLIVDSPTPGHGHAYGWVPESIDMSTIPGTFAGGEIRRHNPSTKTASMVLGPWALRSDGIYTPRGTARTIAVLPESLIEYLVTSARDRDQVRAAARDPDDDGWVISKGRHTWLVDRARWMRGNGITGDALLDQLVRLDRDRCRPPIASLPAPRGVAEIRSIAGWTDTTIPDDQPGFLLVDDAQGVIEPDLVGDPWPEPMDAAAYHGILGDIVNVVAESTEADPVGILGSLLPMFGVACGGNRVLYQGSLQRAALSTLLVGDTGFGGRKGTALGIAQAVCGAAYPELDDLWLVGVASGEAIAGHLAREAEKAEKEKRAAEDRVLLVEPEFGRILVIMNREGSTLSAVIRNAWDGVPIGHARARDESLVTSHHVGMLGHITPVELRQRLSDSDASNGFANRILFLAVRRQRLIAFPTSPDDAVRRLTPDLRAAIEAAHVPAELSFDAAARDRWEDFYLELAMTPRLGLAGAVTGRHEAQVARLALVYSLADRSPVVGVDHLEAAIAVAEYARRSAVWALGDSTGNRHADALLRMLADEPLPWKEAKTALGLRTAADMSEVVAVLTSASLAEIVTVRREGGGRPQRIIRAKDAKGAKDAGGARSKKQGSAT